MKTVQKVGVLSVALLCFGGLFAENLLGEVVLNQQEKSSQKAYVLSIDIKDLHSLRISHAVGDVCSREELSMMGARHRPTIGVPIGSVRRGGRYDGCPNELLVLDSVIHSDAGLSRPMLIFDAEERSIEIKQQKNDWHIVVGDMVIPLSAINQPPTSDNDVIAYNALFGRETRSRPDGLELFIENGRLDQVRANMGSMPIPLKGYVLYIGSKHPLIGVNWQDYLNKPCMYPWANSLDLGKKDIFAAQGLLMLVDQGTVIGNWEQQLVANGIPKRLADEIGHDLNDPDKRASFIKLPSTHTALGLTAEGLLKIATVEAATLDQLAALMQGIGCVSAMLANTGGDAGLWVGGSLVTQPEGEERPIGSAVLFFEEEQQ